MALPRDPFLLLSYVNTQLRDFYPSLDALCGDLQVDAEEITRPLAAIGCVYSAGRNQFVQE